MDFSLVIRTIVEIGVTIAFVVGLSAFSTLLKSLQRKSKYGDALKVIQTVVDAVNQTYVNDLKKEGSFSKEAQVKALYDCTETVKTLLANELISFINKETNGNIDTYIQTQIESYINEGKIP